MKTEQCYVAAWPTQQTITTLKEMGVVRDNLHLTTFFDGYDQLKWLKPFPWKDGWPLEATITKVTEWETPTGHNLMVAELSCPDNWSVRINQWYRLQGGREDMPHKPHITLAKNAPEGMAAHFQRLVGLRLCFNRHGEEK